MKDALLSAAKVRTGTIKLEGQLLTIREVGTEEFAKFGTTSNDKRDDKGNVISKGDRIKGSAGLIAACVVDAETGLPLFTEEEALPLASVARMATPIVNKIMEVSGFGEEEPEKHPVAG